MYLLKLLIIIKLQNTMKGRHYCLGQSLPLNPCIPTDCSLFALFLYEEEHTLLSHVFSWLASLIHVKPREVEKQSEK